MKNGFVDKDDLYSSDEDLDSICSDLSDLTSISKSSNSSRMSRVSAISSISEKLNEKMIKNIHDDCFVSDRIFQKPEAVNKHQKYFCNLCCKFFTSSISYTRHQELKTPCNLVFTTKYVFKQKIKSLNQSYNDIVQIYDNLDVPETVAERIRKMTMNKAKQCLNLENKLNVESDIKKCIKRILLNCNNRNFDSDSIDDISDEI